MSKKKKEYCIGCGFPRVNWGAYSCPLCYCPQTFWRIKRNNWLKNFLDRIYWIFIKLPHLKKHYKEMAYMHIENGILKFH